MEDQSQDRSVLSHIEQMVAEEHRLFERKELGEEDSKRLVDIQTKLDQCWDLLRQRRALRETGQDPSQAHVRASDVVKKYIA